MAYPGRGRQHIPFESGPRRARCKRHRGHGALINLSGTGVPRGDGFCREDRGPACGDRIGGSSISKASQKTPSTGATSAAGVFTKIRMSQNKVALKYVADGSNNATSATTGPTRASYEPGRRLPAERSGDGKGRYTDFIEGDESADAGTSRPLRARPPRVPLRGENHEGRRSRVDTRSTGVPQV